MMKNRLKYSMSIIGLLLLSAGLILLSTVSETRGIMLVLPYVCMALGCGMFGQSLGSIVNDRAMKKDPKLKKQKEIEENDERNIAIFNKAKARAYDFMLYVFGALMLVFALMSKDISTVLLLVASYLFVVGVFIFYLIKYQNEM